MLAITRKVNPRTLILLIAIVGTYTNMIKYISY